MRATLEKLIAEGLDIIGAASDSFVVEHPVDLSHGDYTTNAALTSAKDLGKTPREVASLLAEYIENHKPRDLEVIEIAGPGFINFRLSKDYFKAKVGEIIEKGSSFGKTEVFSREKVIVEHTDPNPFKEFHIGHLMPNVIGSTIARLFEWNGAEVKQANYQGDVGMHVAKAVWAMKQGITQDAYVAGNKAFEEDESLKKEITEINKKIYDRSDEEINKLYDEGRRASLEYFESIYEKLGTKFDYYFFESETAPEGKKLVEENIGEIFEESDGAVVFHAEKYDPSLHTRVFINSEGLPTYEAKELGLAKIKFEKYPYTRSIVVTANEIKEYFRVLLAAMHYVLPDLADKTKHLPHGLLRLPTGKMSSRTGNVTPAVTLIEDVKKVIEEKGNKASDEIAVAAIKYMILKQAIGGDIIFDFDKSISTEGDSGVYLQYAYARASSVISKMKAGTSVEFKKTSEPEVEEGVSRLEKLLYRFPEVVERAGKEYAPHYITTYLIEIAGAFNSFYAHNQIINPDDEEKTRERIDITEATRQVLKNGLIILGIPVLERM
jgi:arginyl-tRNA synthetase